MSYDVLFVRPASRTDLLDEARQLAISEFEEETETAPSADADRKREALVKDLLSLHPSLSMNPADDGFSSGCWIGSENDDCPIPNIELGVASGMVAISYSSSSDTLRQLDSVL